METERDFPCECHDTDEAHDAYEAAASAEWAAYFGRNHRAFAPVGSKAYEEDMEACAEAGRPVNWSAK